MILVAICDDDSRHRALTADFLHTFLEEHPQFSAKVTEFPTGDELCEYTSIHGGFDLYLMDIVMPGTDGVKLGLTLRSRGDNGQIIYLTTESSFAVDAYDVHPFHYLLKPLNRDKLFAVLFDVFSRFNQLSTKALSVKTDSGFVKIPYDEIVYAELSSRRICYHLVDGTCVQSVMLRITFAETVSPLLADPRFILCGASFLVNLHQVRTIDKTVVSTEGGLTFTPPKKSIPDLRSKWLDYWLEGNAHP